MMGNWGSWAVLTSGILFLGVILPMTIMVVIDDALRERREKREAEAKAKAQAEAGKSGLLIIPPAG